ncbi:MAG: hypothetical protein COY70_01615, partial [Candidatus Magasanikbacteria bacterium CG_4_10_14_0_8_um_filter_42_12]
MPPLLFMKQAFSKINTFLVFFNLCIMLGIAYLWYPVLREDNTDMQVATSIHSETGNLKIDIGDTVQVNTTTTEQNDIQSASSTHATTTEENEADSSIEIVPPPAILNLDVPFTSQAPESNWDQPWQDACEEATILMLDAYYKGYNLSPLFAKDELLKMVDWETERNWGNSISLEYVQEVAEWYMGDSFS